jgi:hypothetical protein
MAVTAGWHCLFQRTTYTLHAALQRIGASMTSLMRLGMLAVAIAAQRKPGFVRHFIGPADGEATARLASARCMP